MVILFQQSPGNAIDMDLRFILADENHQVYPFKTREEKDSIKLEAMTDQEKQYFQKPLIAIFAADTYLEFDNLVPYYQKSNTFVNINITDTKKAYTRYKRVYDQPNIDFI